MNNYDAQEGRLAIEIIERGGLILVSLRDRIGASNFPQEALDSLDALKAAIDDLHDQLADIESLNNLNSGGDPKS